MGEVEGGKRGKCQPRAEGRPIQEGDTLPRHLRIRVLGAWCIKSDILACHNHEWDVWG